MHNDGGKRPYVILVDLLYKGKKQTFAIPCRSNIKGDVPSHTYFNLPTRYTTRSGNKHGLHYIKIIPINKKLTENVKIYDNSKMYLELIEKNSDKIRKELQYILDEYCKGNKEQYCTNLEILFPIYKAELEKTKSYDKLRVSLKPNVLKNNLLRINKIEDIHIEEYINIKNGVLKAYEVTDVMDMKYHKLIKIYVEDRLKQVKYIELKAYVRNIASEVKTESIERETVQS